MKSETHSSGPSETGDRARLISHLRSIKRHVPPEFYSDWKAINEAADLLTAQAATLEAAEFKFAEAMRQLTAALQREQSVIVDAQNAEAKLEAAERDLADQRDSREFWSQGVDYLQAKLEAAERLIVKWEHQPGVRFHICANELEAALSSASARPAEQKSDGVLWTAAGAVLVSRLQIAKAALEQWCSSSRGQAFNAVYREWHDCRPEKVALLIQSVSDELAEALTTAESAGADAGEPAPRRQSCSAPTKHPDGYQVGCEKLRDHEGDHVAFIGAPDEFTWGATRALCRAQSPFTNYKCCEWEGHRTPHICPSGRTWTNNRHAEASDAPRDAQLAPADLSARLPEEQP